MALNKYKGFLPGDAYPAENANSINPNSLEALAIGYLTGANNPSALSVFESLGAGANNGKFKVNVDGIVYDNVGIDLTGFSATATKDVYYETDNTSQAQMYAARWFFQTFTTLSTKLTLDKISLYAYKYGTPGGNLNCSIYLAGGDNKPTGSPLKTVATPGVDFNLYSAAWKDIQFDLSLEASTKYVIVCSAPSESTGGTNVINWARGTTSPIGEYGASTDSGANWTITAGYSLDFRAYFKSSYFDVAAKVQAAIRALTSKLETFVWSTNHFIATSATYGQFSKILKFMTPSTGTDISGVGGTLYLDCGTNATEMLGTGNNLDLARLNDNGEVPRSLIRRLNYSIADQAISASTRTYITGSKLLIPGVLTAGTVLKWRFNITKTAAGTAASTFDICFGSAGSTSDPAIVSFTKPGGSAAADEGWIEIYATVRSNGASGVMVGQFTLIHNLASTGHATIPCVAVNTISSAVDMTTVWKSLGICITSGASDAITIKMVQAEMIQNI